jgi:Cu(I)/Ag(I) efflux system membrane protein CusA/SilA
MLVILACAAAVVFALHAMRNIRLDAIPDLSDTQVIVYTKWDRSPDIIEDQVTYPVITALLGAPKVKAVRGVSDFGFSYVYVIFEDGTDIYWARSRVLEYLQKIGGSLPPGVTPELGPDATGVGWVFQYALADKSGSHDLAALRTYQDWTLRYALQGVPGVAEVAGIGGFQKQYQVTIDPALMQSYRVSLMDVAGAIKRSNSEVGGRLLEWAGTEFMVRGKGYVKSTAELEQVVVKTNGKGTPVLLRDVARVALGPQMRRGVSDFNGAGDTVGGIVVMRHGENALNTIERVKKKLEELKPSLPAGVEVVTTYDRSTLIKESIANLRHELVLTMIVVSLVILFFLWHFPSAIVPIITIPISVVLCFIPMYLLGLGSNIMSLAGIVLCIGVLVDGAIVEVENAYKKIERWQEDGCPGDFHEVRLSALMEVGPSIFFSLAVIAVSFLPVFTLPGQEGRLFTPLAWTKTLAMALAALLAVTLDPAVRMAFARYKPFAFRPAWLAKLATGTLVGRYYPEEKQPVSRVLFRLYERPCRFVLRHPRATIITAALIVASAVPVYMKLGSEFMPPLYEGTVLYMPTTMPGLSVTEAQRLMELEDRILKSFPEVVSVFGKAGRADTATDPAPFSMMETTVVLKPPGEWRQKKRWYSGRVPERLQAPLRAVWPDRISYEELIAAMDSALQIPGNANAWTMPIKGRIDMLSTGIRTPIGIKVLGADLKQIQRLGEQVEGVLRTVDGTRMAFAERTSVGYFVDIDPRRDQLARSGLTVEDLQSVIMAAIGGDTVSTTIEGRERYSINLRYPRDLRTELDQLHRVLVPVMDGAQVPMSELADITLVSGPAMIRDEGGMLAGYVFAETTGRDIGGYVAAAKKAVAEKVKMPDGYSLQWSGHYENMLLGSQRLWGWTKVPGIPWKLPLFGIVQLTIVLVGLLLYLNTKSLFKTAVVMLAVPFSVVGAVWCLFLLGYNISTAVWVGMIALMGLDAETGVFMLMFLDMSYDDAKRKGRLRNKEELVEAIIHGAVKRIRPKLMTVGTMFIGLMPVMWSTGTGADLMKRVAAPMTGGLVTSFIMELLVYPAIYLLWRSRQIKVPSAPGDTAPAMDAAARPAQGSA